MTATTMERSGSVAERFAGLPYEQQAAMCRVVGVDLATLPERHIDDGTSFLDVVTASGYYRYTQPQWSVVLRAFASPWPDRGLEWVLDVISRTPDDSRGVYGLSPDEARDLSAAVTEASAMLARLLEICA